MLTGTVLEATLSGVRPLAGVPLDISEEYVQRSPRITSDRDGRYAVSFDAFTRVKVAAEKAGYSQPCRHSNAHAPDGVVDVYVVSNALLAQTGIPASFPIVEPTLTGRVLGPDRQPRSGISVYIDFSGGFGTAPSATTVTDADGRYLLCNVQDVGWGLIANAHKYPHYSDYVPVSIPLPTSLDLDLVPRP